MTTPEPKSAWETETGLINDVDAYVTSPRFGKKDEYAAAVQATGAEGGEMFIVDLVGKDGELLASQGYSIGTGWIISDDGLEITHPKRKNVVGSSVYGQLQDRVVKGLGVNMDQYGLPTKATSWNGLGFHWMQEEHATVGGDRKTSVMPTEFLGKKEGIAVAAPASPAAPAAAPVSDIEPVLAALVGASENVKSFQMTAIKLPAVVANDTLMASVLDDGPEGFYAKHKT